MEGNFRIEKPFEAKPPRLRDLINKYVMADVWVRVDPELVAITDSLVIARKFTMQHKHVLRAIDKCRKELSIQPKFGLNKNFSESSYLGGSKGKKRALRKVDIAEFGLALLLIYLNSQSTADLS